MVKCSLEHNARFNRAFTVSKTFGIRRDFIGSVCSSERNKVTTTNGDLRCSYCSLVLLFGTRNAVEGHGMFAATSFCPMTVIL